MTTCNVLSNPGLAPETEKGHNGADSSTTQRFTADNVQMYCIHPEHLSKWLLLNSFKRNWFAHHP
jgi:hypothetical protein